MYGIHCFDIYLTCKTIFMTKDEFNLALNEASEAYKKRKREIYREYAFSNNPYKVGDKITDHAATIEIKGFKVYVGYDGIPECVYNGIQFNKDGKVNKKQDHNTIHQSNIIKN